MYEDPLTKLACDKVDLFMRTMATSEFRSAIWEIAYQVLDHSCNKHCNLIDWLPRDFEDLRVLQNPRFAQDFTESPLVF